MSLVPVDTAFGLLGGTLTITRTKEVPEVSDELWYRDNDTSQQLVRIDSYREAEDIIRSRNPRSPWATIVRIVDTGFDDEHYRMHSLEVLGWADRVYVCGDSCGVGWQWRWSSWPAGAYTGHLTVSHVGPAWYQAKVWEEQLVTVNDAVAQLWPATHATRDDTWQAPGYRWLPRDLDCDPNQHLRAPLD